MGSQVPVAPASEPVNKVRGTGLRAGVPVEPEDLHFRRSAADTGGDAGPTRLHPLRVSVVNF